MALLKRAERAGNGDLPVCRRDGFSTCMPARSIHDQQNSVELCGDSVFATVSADTAQPSR